MNAGDLIRVLQCFADDAPVFVVFDDPQAEVKGEIFDILATGPMGCDAPMALALHVARPVNPLAEASCLYCGGAGERYSDENTEPALAVEQARWALRVQPGVDDCRWRNEA